MVLQKRQSGFTLIEMLVSLGVFSVVITTAVGALLMLVATNDQLQGEQSVMTNLSFALDSMTREIRTGTDYHCRSASSYTMYGSSNMFRVGNDLDTIFTSGIADTNGVRNCTGKSNSSLPLHGLSFAEGGDSVSGSDDRILYFHDSDTGQLYRRVGTGDAVPITASGIYIHRAEFFVTGSAPSSAGDDSQASVTIQIEASEDASTPVGERVTLQTTVSQRTLDI